MKLKIKLKNPINFNLLVLSVFPTIFILIGLISYLSETIQIIFFSPVHVYSYLMGLLAGIFGANVDNVYNMLFTLFCNYTFMFSVYFLMLSGNILAFYLYEHGMTGIYKKVEIIFYIILMLLLISTFVNIGFMLSYSIGIIFMVILFLPTMFLMSSGIGKTVAIKSWKKNKK